MQHIASLRRIKKVTAATLLIATVALLATFDPSHQASAATSDWERGVNMVSGSPNDFASSAFNQSVVNAKTLGVNYITLNIPLYQSNASSVDVQTGGNTPSDQTLTNAIKFIHAQGMHVMLKFDLFPNDGQWSAYINPSDRTNWFKNYGTLIDHYAALAQSTGVEQICLGTELIDMTSANVNPTNTQNWETLIAGVRNIYSGNLTYDANWGDSGWAEETSQIEFWSALDYISISAYFNLTGDGSVSALMTSWNSWNKSNIAPLQAKWNKPVIFGEVGYRAIQDSYQHPWMWWESGTADPTQQANDYQALFQYWNNYPWFAGLNLWNWSNDPNAGGPNDANYTPQNKAAQSVMQTWFQGNTASNGSPIFTAHASVSPTEPAPGQTASIAMKVSDTNSAASNVNVDAEIYNSSGQRVFQQVFTGQNFTLNQTQSYTLAWTPPGSGTYALKTGIFTGDWHTLYYWNDATLSMAVARAPTSGGTIDVWWPSNGSSVSGVQPFQAMLENASLNSYAMYWQVDGGQLNPMSDSNVNYPHKEASVDVSPWTWQPSGNYTITFVAQTLNGQPIATQSVVVHVTH